jgi:hypothetical protein
MASAIDLIYSDIVSRIKSITPTSTISNERFEFNERPLTLSADQSSGMARSFTVYFDSSDEDLEPTDMHERWCQAEFTVEVAYSTDYELEDLFKLIAQDRHDLCKELRHNTDATKGLHGCVRVGDEVDRRSDTTWYLRQTWSCDVREGE